MKSKMSFLFLTLCLVALASGCGTKVTKDGGMPKLAVQSYTFHTFTLLEAFDKCQQLGVEYIEVYPGHKIGGRWGDRAFDASLDAESQKELIALAAEKGVRMVAAGVYTGDDMAEWENFFRLAHDMGMEYITCEPPMEAWDTIEALSKKYGIKVAVHNHPRPSSYWHPDSLLMAVEGRSLDLGSCADVGHWKREGLDHMACLEKLSGRLISFHFKDIIAKPANGQEQHDTVWGTGILDVPGMVSFLKIERFDGYLSIEYEYHWDTSVPEIRHSIEYLKTLYRQ